MNVAIIGSGIAGLGAARALVAANHAVTIFEAAARPGGHVYTVDHAGVSVDMGFIVCNRERYPLFFRLLADLQIETRPTTMSFSVSLPHLDLEWGSESLSSLFADRATLTSSRHWRFLLAVVGFLRTARRDLDVGATAALSLDEYLAHRRLPAEIREQFVIPLAAALWSLAPDACGAFPADTFLRFLDQHGMLRAVRPLAWRTIVGGSRCYADALIAQLPSGTVRLSTPVTRIARDAHGVTIVTGGAGSSSAASSSAALSNAASSTVGRFDRVIIATHADTALAMLEVPTPDESAALGAFRYSTNATVLHRDPAFLPRRRAAHASWNYVADPDTAQVAVTYSMSRLQGLPADPPYLVTLNPRSRPASVIHEVSFTHPQFDRAALLAQGNLARLNGTNRTYFAGAHFGFGFHEDGLRAGLAAAARAIADEAGR
ncbi:MAG: NAD(P)/FAD-dependent oxidoreductase [Kofleriaceae bacterium]